MTLLYDGKKIGFILTNHGMTIDEALNILNIDINEMIDSNDYKWNYELFDLVA
jgi:hypothetical protein